MVIIRISFGLGNQLFMYAAARCQAFKLNTELKIDMSYYESQDEIFSWDEYKLTDFNIIENYATKEEIENLGPEDVYMKIGLWQKEDFFIEAEDIIRKEFTLKNPLSEKAAVQKEKILSADCPVSLHIRRGAYSDSRFFQVLFGVLPLEYYENACRNLKDTVGNFTLFVFSDDLEWAKKNLNFGIPVEFVERCERASEEMYLMSLCKHNIIANSTFSWWGAWLNQNPDKKVFAPTPWFRNATISGSKDGIIPNSWIKIPVNFDKKADFNKTPLLSIVLYIENANADLNKTFLGILSQTLREYELIIVDASDNNDIPPYRRLVATENITFIKKDSSTNKESAWNTGINCARGFYILFLDGKDFIMPYTSHTIFQVWQIYVEKFRKKTPYPDLEKDFKDKMPDVIFTSRSLSEDEKGNVNVNGIPNKKFSIKIDSALRHLNTTAEINPSGEDKLKALSMRGINRDFGTKVFKRSFLLENQIKFDETKGVDAELLFLVETFMRSKITFFNPQIYCGRVK